MTIEVFGHVRSVETYPIGKVLVTIHVESSRMPDHTTVRTGPTIEIIASKEETASYRPGMGIAIQIRPHPTPSTSAGESK